MMTKHNRGDRAGVPYQVPRYLREMRRRRREGQRSILPYIFVIAILLVVWVVLSGAEPRVTGIDSGTGQAPVIHWGGGPRN